MKQIFVNLKRFDVPRAMGGICTAQDITRMGQEVVRQLDEGFAATPTEGLAHCTVFFPEAHVLSAVSARQPGSKVGIGCQGVFREDVAKGSNFGAFTANRPAAAAKALGCEWALIGHCEERKDKAGILAEAGCTDDAAVNRLLAREIRCAQGQGLKVLYCIGERAEQQEAWQEVLGQQLSLGLEGAGRENIVIAYEPVWAIGPGKTPPDAAYIQKIAQFVKEQTGGLPVVYGGGLKQDNAAMLASIPQVDGGLIGLTRFSGEIGFYPEECLDIITLYLGGAQA